jgi:hypothetical protein
VARQAKRDVDVGLHGTQDVANAPLASSCNGPRPSATDQDRARSERHHLDDVEAAAHAAVGEHFDAVPDRIRDVG